MARPVIGYRESVLKFSRDDLERFHEKWYCPDNMKLVVVGNLDINQAFSKAQHYFGGATRQSYQFDPAFLVPEEKPWAQIQIVEEDCEQAPARNCLQSTGDGSSRPGLS